MLEVLGFLGSSAGKESTCNAGDLGSIPWSGSSPGERIVYPLQYYWTSLVAQTIKNPPVVWKTWVRSVGWEDPLEEGMVAHSSIGEGNGNPFQYSCLEKPTDMGA